MTRLDRELLSWSSCCVQSVCEIWSHDPFFQIFIGEEKFRQAYSHECSGLSQLALAARQQARAIEEFDRLLDAQRVKLGDHVFALPRPQP